MAKLVSDVTAGRILRLLTRAEAAGGGGRGHGGAKWGLVRCDSATAVGGTEVLDECYPATLLRPAADAAAPPEDLSAVLLTVLGSGGTATAPVAGALYACLLTGEVLADRTGSGSAAEAGRYRAFGLSPAAGGTPPPAGGCEGCEWTAGLTQTDCLRATVIEGRGACSCPDSVLNEPAGMFSVDGTTWITPQIVTPEQPEGHLTICGTDYDVTFTRQACDGPCLTLTARSGSQETYTTVRGCCGCNYAVFGVRLPTCDAAGNPCGPCQNLVRIRVEWVPCDPIISEDGWYCIKPVGAPDSQCAPVELFVFEDGCRTDFTVCSGPHATQEIAEGFCGTFVTGGPSCAAAVVIPLNEWRRGYLAPSPQPTQYFCVPATAGQTYKMHASANSLPLSEGLRVTVFWAADECGTLVDGVPAANFATRSPPSSPSCHNIGTAPVGATRMCVTVRHEYVFSGAEFNIRVSTGTC